MLVRNSQLKKSALSARKCCLYFFWHGVIKVLGHPDLSGHGAGLPQLATRVDNDQLTLPNCQCKQPDLTQSKNKGLREEPL